MQDGGGNVSVAGRGVQDGALPETGAARQQHIAGFVGAHRPVLPLARPQVGGIGPPAIPGGVDAPIPAERQRQLRGARPLQAHQRRRQRPRQRPGGVRGHHRPAPGLGEQPARQPFAAIPKGGRVIPVHIEQRRAAIGRQRHPARPVARRKSGLPQQRLQPHRRNDGGIAVVGQHEYIGVAVAAIGCHPL